MGTALPQQQRYFMVLPIVCGRTSGPSERHLAIEKDSYGTLRTDMQPSRLEVAP